MTALDGQRRSAPGWSANDSYSMAARLCDDDGIVRRGAMHHGTDYACTGHAHYAGEHIRCVSAGHPDGLPADLWALLGSMPDDGLDIPAPDAGSQRSQRLIAEIEGRDHA